MLWNTLYKSLFLLSSDFLNSHLSPLPSLLFFFFFQFFFSFRHSYLVSNPVANFATFELASLLFLAIYCITYYHWFLLLLASREMKLTGSISRRLMKYYGHVIYALVMVNMIVYFVFLYIVWVAAAPLVIEHLPCHIESTEILIHTDNIKYLKFTYEGNIFFLQFFQFFFVFPVYYKFPFFFFFFFF